MVIDIVLVVFFNLTKTYQGQFLTILYSFDTLIILLHQEIYTVESNSNVSTKFTVLHILWDPEFHYVSENTILFLHKWHEIAIDNRQINTFGITLTMELLDFFELTCLKFVAFLKSLSKINKVLHLILISQSL